MDRADGIAIDWYVLELGIEFMFDVEQGSRSIYTTSELMFYFEGNVSMSIVTIRIGDKPALDLTTILKMWLSPLLLQG